jgi:glycine cleavage system H protein
MYPDDRLYAKTHEWALVETDAAGAKIVTVGITAFAVESLTDLVYMELPEVGRAVRAGESFGEIESVKAVSDLYSPATGEVIAVNSQLPDRLEILNQDPYGAGWMIKIRLASEAGLGSLMDSAAYQKQIAEEH